MDDRTIQDAIHALPDNYDVLESLLACYEAWGGRSINDADCACLLEPSAGAAK